MASRRAKRLAKQLTEMHDSAGAAGAAGDGDGAAAAGVGSRKRSRLDKEDAETRDAYKTEIRRLQAGIRGMQRQVSEARAATADGLSVDMIVQGLLDSTRTLFSDGVALGEDDPAADVESSLRQLTAIETFTGIQFVDATSHMVNPLPTGARVRRYSLSGSSFGLSFSISFHVNEDERRITTVNAAVDSRCQAELAAFAVSVEAQKSPLAFFRGFSEYAECNADRSQVFRNVARAFPGVVRLPRGSLCAPILLVNLPDSSSPVLSLTWDIKVHPHGRVETRLHLWALKLDLDEEHSVVLAEVPSMFKVLCRMKGIEHALSIIVQALLGVAPAEG